MLEDMYANIGGGGTNICWICPLLLEVTVYGTTNADPTRGDVACVGETSRGVGMTSADGKHGEISHEHHGNAPFFASGTTGLWAETGWYRSCMSHAIGGKTHKELRLRSSGRRSMSLGIGGKTRYFQGRFLYEERLCPLLLGVNGTGAAA